MSDRGTLRMQRSWVVGLRRGLRALKRAEWKMRSVKDSGTKTSSRVHQKKPPTVAAPPMVVSLRKRLKIPIVGSIQLTKLYPKMWPKAEESRGWMKERDDVAELREVIA